MKPSNQQIKNFKKKTSNLVIDVPTANTVDKFNELKCKLEKQKEIMKKTGRRFREDNSLAPSNSEETAPKIDNSKNREISIGPDAPAKERISLKDINLADQSMDSESLKSSKVFERQIKNQKKRCEELHAFLRKVELEAFAEALIECGFDDVQTLSEVSSEDLNHLMMRAGQQDRLMAAIKQFKAEKNIQNNSAIQSGVKASLWRVKTDSRPQTSHEKNVSSTVSILTRLKTSPNIEETKSGELKTGSFLYTVGSRNWGVQDQIRRACSACFKVEQQMEKKGDCYYCSRCYKYMADDLLTISLKDTLTKSYQKS